MNTQIAVAAHILTFLATRQREPTTSELLASSINTNPSFVRRVLSRLAKAGLTTSQMGTGGGALLAKPSDGITMLDVYRAMEGGDLFGFSEGANMRCPIGRNFHPMLRERMAGAEQAARDELARITIADLAAEVVVRASEGGVP